MNGSCKVFYVKRKRNKEWLNKEWEFMLAQQLQAAQVSSNMKVFLPLV